MTTGGKDKSSIITSTIAEDQPKKKKAKAEPGQADREEPHYTQKVEIHVKIPDDLKDRLADDWDFICRQKKLVKLPCEFTVDKILDEYLVQKVSVKGTTPCKESIVAEFTAGALNDPIYLFSSSYTRDENLDICRAQSNKCKCVLISIAHRGLKWTKM